MRVQYGVGVRSRLHMGRVLVRFVDRLWRLGPRFMLVNHARRCLLYSAYTYCLCCVHVVSSFELSPENVLKHARLHRL